MILQGRLRLPLVVLYLMYRAMTAGYKKRCRSEQAGIVFHYIETSLLFVLVEVRLRNLAELAVELLLAGNTVVVGART